MVMMATRRCGAGAVACLLALCAAAGVAADDADCLDLGFTEALQCATCDRLDAATDGDDDIVGECRRCCSDFDIKEDMSGMTYATAKLVVCQ